MICYSQESIKIKVKDNQLKITQITVTQNYSLLNFTHCSKLLIAHLLNFTQSESESESKEIHVNGDYSYPKYFINMSDFE